MRSGRRTYRHLSLGVSVGAGALAVIALYHLFFAPPSRAADDYYQFWVIGQATRTMDVDNVYGTRERSRIRSEFYRRASTDRGSHELRAVKLRKKLYPAGTPLFYSMFALASTGDYDTDYRNFKVFSAALFLGGMILLAHLRRVGWIETAVLLAAWTFFTLPYEIEVASANVNQLQVGALAVLLCLRRRLLRRTREFASAFLLASLVLFKPNLFLVGTALGVYWLVESAPHARLLHLGGYVAAMIAAVLLPSLILGDACNWGDWLTSVQKILSRSYYIDTSFPGMLLPSIKWTASRVATGIAFLVPLGLLLLPDDARGETDDRKFREETLMVAMGICGYLLSASLVHGHYFVLAAPVMVILMPSTNDFFGATRQDCWLRWSVLAIAFVLLANPAIVSYGLTPKKTHSIGAYMGCLILYVLSILDFRRLRTNQFAGYHSAAPAEPGR